MDDSPDVCFPKSNIPNPAGRFLETPKSAYDYTLTLSNYRLRLLKAKCPRDLLRIAVQLVNELGFSDITVTRMDGVPDPDCNLVSTPVAISKKYKEPGVWERSFMLKNAKRATSPYRNCLFQSDIDKFLEATPPGLIHEDFESNREARAISLELGYLDYFGMPIQAANGNGNVLVAITSQKMDVPDFKKKILQQHDLLRLIGQEIDYVSTTQFSSHLLGPGESRVPVINPRPLQVLELASFDLTQAQIARKLEISEKTVAAHIAAIKQALGASTALGAFRLAVQHGFLELPVRKL